MVPGETVSPYTARADVLRPAFIDHAVSEFEESVNRPRFAALLPGSAIVRRILDLGCGPAYPEDWRALYPDAEILGIDLPEMLPEPRTDDPNTHFDSWSGPPSRRDEVRALRQKYGKFDLIILKMVAHNFRPSELNNLMRMSSWLLARGGSIALSLPHPEESARFVKNPDLSESYEREIGSTGVTALMTYYEFLSRRGTGWTGDILSNRLPNSYRRVIDEPATEDGKKKRLNILLRPPTARERVTDALHHLVGRQPTQTILLTPHDPVRNRTEQRTIDVL